MNRSLIATAVLVLLGLAAPVGLGGLVLPVHAQDDGGDPQSDDAGDQTETDDQAPAPVADPGKAATANPGTAPANGAEVACVEDKPCPEVVCVVGKPCFKDLTLGGHIVTRVQGDFHQK